MSGILCIVNLDGAPVDRELLRSMTDFMAYRGPDAQEIWFDGHVGMGHTMLRTTFESEYETQPFSLDGTTWITADARVDGREELIDKLQSKQELKLDINRVTDVELILRAYQVWGEDCVQHLIGDFAFVIWDGRERKLFGARDHFGVKPFYYAQVGRSLIISNTLNCVRLHPQVSDELNEAAIADFLLFDYNQTDSTTSFSDIQRLPRSHVIRVTGSAIQSRCYWTLPLGDPVKYRKAVHYVEGFRERLRRAVGDRLRSRQVGVLMSGGLDSTSVAAAARNLLTERGEKFDLQAHTAVFDALVPDEERYFSGQAAGALGIPINYVDVAQYRPFERWSVTGLTWNQPVNEPFTALTTDLFAGLAENSRIALTGFGGDSALYPSKSALRAAAKSRGIGSVLWYSARYVASYRRIPRLGLRTFIRKLLGRTVEQPDYPQWLDPGLERRLDLRARWHDLWNPRPERHGLRPEARQGLQDVFWPNLFEFYDNGVSHSGLVARHPFFDVRLVSFSLGLPTVPWCLDKEVLRRSVRGWLPNEIRRRPKTPMQGDSVQEFVRRYGAGDFTRVVPSDELLGYVAFRPEPTPKLGYDAFWNAMRVICLDYWLRESRCRPVHSDIELAVGAASG